MFSWLRFLHFYVVNRCCNEQTCSDLKIFASRAKLYTYVLKNKFSSVFFEGSGYFAVDGNLPSETILP